MNDPIVDEIRIIRDAHAALFNYDLEAIYLDIKQREKEREEKTGRKFIPAPLRQVEPPTAPPPAAPAGPRLAGTTLPEEAMNDPFIDDSTAMPMRPVSITT